MEKNDLIQYPINTSNRNYNKQYHIYKHTSPSGKVYIGKTCYKNPSWRWKKNGEGYKGSPLFYNAIKKYGWDKIQHEILYSDLTYEEAFYKEIELIKYYKELGISYNYTDGGEGTRIKHSPEWNKHVSEGQKGKKMSEESKEKMRQSHLGKKLSENHKQNISNSLKGKKKSAEHCKHIKENHWDGSGENHPNYGKHMSEETKYKIGNANSGKIGVNKDGKEIRIEKSELKKYIENGWQKGGLPKPKNKKHIDYKANKTKLKKGDEIIYVLNSEVTPYIETGWEICNQRRRRQYRLHGVIKY